MIVVKLITPYGNITTDPRLIHLTGEKMVFTCDTANKEVNKKNRNKTEINDSVFEAIGNVFEGTQSLDMALII